MVTIELNNDTNNDTKNDTKNVIVEVEPEKNNDEINETHANNKCANGCNLICTGLSYICSFFGYYMYKLYRNIKKCFN